MIFEIGIQTVEPSRRDEYVEVYKRAIREAAFPGWHGCRVMVCIEDPSRTIAINEWDSAEAHAAVRGTPAHTRFREKVSPYQVQSTQLAHYVPHDA